MGIPKTDVVFSSSSHLGHVSELKEDFGWKIWDEMNTLKWAPLSFIFFFFFFWGNGQPLMGASSFRDIFSWLPFKCPYIYSCTEPWRVHKENIDLVHWPSPLNHPPLHMTMQPEVFRGCKNTHFGKEKEPTHPIITYHLKVWKDHTSRGG